jgi:class 3 adenylate cyclase
MSTVSAAGRVEGKAPGFDARDPAAGPGPRKVVALVALGIAAAAVGAVLPWVGPLRPGVGLASIVVSIAASLTMLAAGLIAWLRQPQNVIWRLMVASCFASFIWELAFVPTSLFWTLAQLLPNLGQAIFAHLMLSFPFGRLRSRIERLLVVAIYVYAIGAPLLGMLFWKPQYVCDPYCPQNLLVIWPANEVADAVSHVTSLGVPIIGLLVAGFVWHHWRQASVPTRRALQPVALALPFALVAAAIGYPADSLGIEAISALVRSPVWLATNFILPLGFLLGVLRLHSARAAVASAVLELGAMPTLTRLQEVLRTRLGDPDLAVVLWSATQGAFIGQDGYAISTPLGDSERRLTVLERQGHPVAAVVHHATLASDSALGDTIRAAAALALDATELRDELRARGGDTSRLPSGEVTFLFADIQGSTPLLESLGERYAGLLAELRRIASSIADQHDGRLVDALGDEVFLAFGTAADAVRSAVELTRRLSVTMWPGDAIVRVRIGLHTGRPELTRAGYVGLDVHRAARIMAAAHGGQILASAAVISSLDRTDQITLRALGRYVLRGIREPETLFVIEADGLPTRFPPPRAELAG